MMSVPQFIIGGAPRSGTTWLYALLDRHPQIYMAKPPKPEPKFFLVDNLYERGFPYYLETWFGHVGPGMIAGEKSTNYLEGANVASRIHRYLPDVKLIFILREPADRALSNYRWSVMNGLETEDFASALGMEEKREHSLEPQMRFVRPHAYFSRGLYAELLKPYFAHFPPEQILCLRYEDLALDPEMVANRLHGFLKVEPRPRDVAGLGRINESQGTAEDAPSAVMAKLRERYREPNCALASLLGPEFEVWN